jgi:hypothetical protein
VLDTRNLTARPGTTFAYSNFGYVLLGRVIEAVTNVRNGERMYKSCGHTRYSSHNIHNEIRAMPS